MTVEISDIMGFMESVLQADGVEHVIIDGIVEEGPLNLYVVAVDGNATEFYADPYETREPIDYVYANQQLVEETYNVDIEAVPEDDLEVHIVFRKRRVLSAETLYRTGFITRDAFAYVQNRYTDGANIAVTGADHDGIATFINYLLESVRHPPKTVVVDSNSALVFGATNDDLIVISGSDPNVFSMCCQMNPYRIISTDELSEDDAVTLHDAIDKGIKFVCALPDDSNGYVTKEEANHFDLEIEIEAINVDEDYDEDEDTPFRVLSIRDKIQSEPISQYFNGQHIVTI